MIKDFVLETSNAPGSAATINLAGPVIGRVAFASVFTNGAPILYIMDDGTMAEWGAGVFNTGTPNTITRTTVLGNTNNTTARLNFLGTTRVYCEVPSARVTYIDNANELRVPGLRLSTSLGLFTSDSTYTRLYFDSGNWNLRYQRNNGTLIYERGTDAAALFTIDGAGNVSWSGSATVGTLTVSGGATVGGAVTSGGVATAPQFKLTTGGGNLSADANVTQLTFDTNLWRLQYTRANGTLSYLRGTDNVAMFSVDGSGNFTAPQVAANTLKLTNGNGYFSADNNWTYLVFDSASWRLQYQRSNGALAYVRGTDGHSLLAIDPSGNITIAGQASKPGGGPWTDSSDARIKNVTADYGTGLAAILALRPVRFKLKNNWHLVDDSPPPRGSVEMNEYIGLVGQEAEVPMPEMVSKIVAVIDGIEVDDLRILDTTALPFAVVNAIKEIYARLVALETKGGAT